MQRTACINMYFMECLIYHTLLASTEIKHLNTLELRRYQKINV